MMRKQKSTRTVLCLEALEDRCLLSGGVLDPTFGTGGIVTTPVGTYARAFAVATYPIEGTANDGKIVAAGDAYSSTGRTSTEYMAVVRYNLDGTLDRTFGGTGQVMTTLGRPLAVQVQPDGKIVAAGNSGLHFAVVRYNANGTLDSSFGSNGEVITAISKNSSDVVEAMVLQADGKIVVAGETYPTKTTYVDLALVRYNANGSLDTSFGTGGEVTTRFANPLNGHYNPRNVNLAIDPNTSPLDPNSGKIVIGAETVTQAGTMVVRYNTNGTLDTGFGTNHSGYVNLSTPLYNAAVAVQTDDRIVVSGSVNDLVTGSDFGLDRLNPDGTLDASFGSGGVVITSTAPNGDFARSVTIQSDGKIVVAGEHNIAGATPNGFMVARYNTNGSLDTTFGTNGIVTAEAISIGDIPTSVALEPDGRIVIAGFYLGQSPTADKFVLARYLVTGPQIGSFSSSANSVPAGSSLTLTVSNITDANPGSTITQVAFYVDSNHNGVLDSGDALLAGTSTYSNGTWTLTFSTTGWSSGSYKLFAVATDNYGVFSDPLALTLNLI